MKIKLKSKLWVWLYCKKATDADNWTYWMCRRLGDTQVYLCEPVLALAGKVVEVILVDGDALKDTADSAYRLANGHPFWVPNWFIAEVFCDEEAEE